MKTTAAKLNLALNFYHSATCTALTSHIHASVHTLHTWITLLHEDSFYYSPHDFHDKR